MEMYNLIDNELREYYIVAHKYICVISLIIFVVLSIVSIINIFIFALASVFFFISLLFFVTYTLNKNAYGKKLSLCNNTVCVFDHKNNKIVEFELNTINSCYLSVGFDNKNPRFVYKKCLIFYNEKIEPYDEMEYRSFKNCKDLVIIQNPNLISYLELEM